MILIVKRAYIASLVIPFAKCRRFSSIKVAMSHFTPKILSIQSHTVHGYVGNKAATFPLQSLGFNVDCINTISLSNEPGYSGGFKGQTMSAVNLSDVVSGLDGNNLLNHDIILTGYTRTPELLDQVEKTIKKVQANNPNTIYLCDPVMGDNDKYYVPAELCEKYKQQILPLATVITPNYFEAEMLSGISIKTFADAVKACEQLLSYGPKICVLTGLSLEDSSTAAASFDVEDTDEASRSKVKQLTILIAYKALNSLKVDQADSMSSTDNKVTIYRLDFPKIDTIFSGCGDLFSALFAAGVYRCRTALSSSPHLLGHVVEIVTEAMSGVLSLTKELRVGTDQASKELRIIESAHVFRAVADKFDHLSPQTLTLARKLSELEPITHVKARAHLSHTTDTNNVAGVIFDMDGTLTEPHLINFKAMYERNGLQKTPGSDILTLISELPTQEARDKAMDVILEEELLGCERMKFRPHLHSLLYGLQATRVRIAVSTRNCQLAFEKFLEKSELCPTTFTPTLTRDSMDGKLNKPDPALAKYIVKEWNILPGQESSVWFVGDSVDDILCGKQAGCRTCLISSSHSDQIMESHGHLVDVKVDSLLEVAQLFNLPIH